MNPLSSFTYTRRHKGQALLLVGMIAALTLGVFMTFGLTDVIGGAVYYPTHYLTRMSRVTAGGASDATIAAIAGHARTHPDVVYVLPENGLQANVPSVVWSMSFPLLGVAQTDLSTVMNACDLRLKAGRLIEPGAEVVLSEELARALDLQLGDSIGYAIDEDRYPAIVTELTLVGILESNPASAEPGVRVGFVSYEYLDSHELYQPRSSNLLVIPRQGRRVAVNGFLEEIVAQSGASASVRLQTFESETATFGLFLEYFTLVYGFADVLIATAAALVVGMVNRIAVMHRVPDFGLLHAVGYKKRRIVHLLAFEIAAIACAGWSVGLLGAYTLSLLLNSTFFAAQASAIDLATLTPLLFTLPIPLLVIVWVSVDVNLLLRRLDAVAVIERGSLSIEEAEHKRRLSHSSSNPLSPWTFYLRHRRQGFMVITTIGLMVFSVALPAFIVSTSTEAVMPLVLVYTGRVSVVAPGNMYRVVDPGVLAQIRSHPDVARVIPARALTMGVYIPTLGELPMPIYAVREQDLPTLLDVYGLYLSAGELPQPRSNQIILTTALAHNRRLDVGDAVGKPVYERDGMPTEMRVVGLLASARSAFAEREGYDLPPMPLWAGFASYEYVDSHEQYAAAPAHELIVPVAGREAAVEAWLEESIASPRVAVTTLGTSYRAHRVGERNGLLMITLTGSILAVVAVIGLAVLNTIFFTRRREEFGILYAAGYDCSRLLARTLRESASVVSVAWLAGAIFCVGFLLYQANVCTSAGLQMNFFNLTPWLFTLPIPLAVVAASVGAIGWMLKRLDAVSVIEGR
ncbi:MAG: ABC transporter permease [Anaerolineae bacterium]|nr:ABC transporter permease [Anaerolineae bacterium]